MSELVKVFYFVRRKGRSTMCLGPKWERPEDVVVGHTMYEVDGETERFSRTYRIVELKGYEMAQGDTPASVIALVELVPEDFASMKAPTLKRWCADLGMAYHSKAAAIEELQALAFDLEL